MKNWLEDLLSPEDKAALENYVGGPAKTGGASGSWGEPEAAAKAQTTPDVGLPPPVLNPVRLTQISPEMDPAVKDYVMQKYNLGDYSDENRKKLLEENSGYDATGRISAALGALGAGFQRRDANAAGNAILSRNQAERDSKVAQFEKGRANKIQENNLEREAVKNEREDKQYGLDQDRLKREQDPTSQESSLAQTLAKKMLPSKDFSQMSAAQINGLLPSLSKVYEIEQKKIDRNDARTVKSEEKARLSDKQTSELATHDKAIQALDDVMAQKKNWDTGKLSMTMNAAAGLIGMDDAKKSAFKSDVGEQLASYIKSISGATVSPTERASLLENVPSVYDNDATFEAKSNALKKRLIKNREIEVDFLTKQGKNTKNFQVEKSSGEFPRQVRKGNQMATVANAKELKEANDEGFQ